MENLKNTHTHSGIAEISVETFVVTSQANHVARKKNPMHFKEIRKHPLSEGISERPIF